MGLSLLCQWLRDLCIQPPSLLALPLHQQPIGCSKQYILETSQSQLVQNRTPPKPLPYLFIFSLKGTIILLVTRICRLSIILDSLFSLTPLSTAAKYWCFYLLGSHIQTLLSAHTGTTLVQALVTSQLPTHSPFPQVSLHFSILLQKWFSWSIDLTMSLLYSNKFGGSLLPLG